MQLEARNRNGAAGSKVGQITLAHCLAQRDIPLFQFEVYDSTDGGGLEIKGGLKKVDKFLDGVYWRCLIYLA